jgi:hypothetical protein
MKSFAAASLALTIALAVPSVQAAPVRAERPQVESASGGESDFDRAMVIVKRLLKRFGVRASEMPSPPKP